MAKKIQTSIDILGTDKEAKEMGKLQSEIDKVARSLTKLKKIEKEQGALTRSQSEERARLNTQLKATKNAYRDMEAQVLKANNALRKSSGFVAGVQKGFGNVVTSIAGVTAAYFAMKKAIDVVNSVNRDAIKIYNDDRKAAIVFGDTLGYVTAQAEKNAHAIGLTAREYKTAAAATQDLLVPLGMSRGQAAEFSTELTNLSGALSLWDTKQRSSTEISEILTKALLGEAEQAKSLGIVIDQSSKEYNERIEVLMETENITKQQAKAMDILEQITQKTADAQDNFASSADNMALKQAEASAKLREQYETLVVQLTPAYVKLTDVASEVLRVFSELIRFGDALSIADQAEVEQAGLKAEQWAERLIRFAEAQNKSAKEVYDELIRQAEKHRELSEDTEATLLNRKEEEARYNALKLVAEQYGINNGLIGSATTANEENTKSVKDNRKEIEKLSKSLNEYLDKLDQGRRKTLASEDDVSVAGAFGLHPEEPLPEMDAGPDRYQEELDLEADKISEIFRMNQEAAAAQEELWKSAYATIASAGLEAAKGLVSSEFQVRTEAVERQRQQDLRVAQVKLESGILSEKEYLAEQEKIERAALKEKKQLQRNQASINIALAIISAFASVQPTIPAGAAAAAAAATVGAAQLAAIDRVKFARGGKIDRRGGKLKGPSHLLGGIPGVFNGVPFEAEGGELWMVNKQAAKDKKRYSFIGTPEQMVSQVNAIHGGENWAPGATVTSAYQVPESLLKTNHSVDLTGQVASGLDDQNIVQGLNGVRKELGAVRGVINEQAKQKHERL